jgi:hypothetical protein
LDELLADAEQVAAGPYKTLGNWTYGQILTHLTEAMRSTMDGFAFRAPLPMRVIVRLFMKKKFLSKPLPSGFKIPKRFPQPDDVSIDVALGKMRAVIERLKTTEERAFHPFLGKIPKEESDEFQLRHAELHMSFVVPEIDGH